MSGMYGPSDEAESVATIHAAVDAGINVLDTGDFYGMGHNEMLIGRAIAGMRERVLLSVKFGAMRSPSGPFIGVDGRPNAVRNFIAYSLQRLKTSHIDVYRLSRLDPAVPIEETIGVIARLVEEGYVRYIGLSEVGPETIRRAQAVHPICDLQIEYAPVTRARVREGGMTVSGLVSAAIQYSDNTAANVLLRAVGGPASLTTYLRRLGDQSTRLDRFEPDRAEVVERRAEADGLRDRLRSRLELVRQLSPRRLLDFHLPDHVSAEIERLHLLEERRAAPQRSDAARAAELV